MVGTSMSASKALTLFLSTTALAGSLGAANIERQSHRPCHTYPGHEYKTLTSCATASAFCSKYLGRPASTSTVYTSTQTKIVRTTASATISATSSVTDSTTATISVTEMDTATMTSTTVVTTSGPPASCISGDSKVLARSPGPASCGLKGHPSSAISGACACLIDKVSSTRSTTTITTTVATDYTTVYPITVTPATVTVQTATVTPFTTTVSTVTTTITQTTNPTCDADIPTYTTGAGTFNTFCDTNFGQGFVFETITTDDFYSCMDACQNQNLSPNLYTNCTAVTFDQSQCSSNCNLMYGVYAPSVQSGTSQFQSARLISPGAHKWGNSCVNSGNIFGDIVLSAKGVYYQAVCSLGYGGDNINCGAQPGEEVGCIAACDNNSNCTATLSYNAGDFTAHPTWNCCINYAVSDSGFDDNTPYHLDQFVQIDYLETYAPS